VSEVGCKIFMIYFIGRLQ